MTQATIDLRDPRVGYVPQWRAARLGLKPLPGPSLRPGAVAVAPEVARAALRAPRACAGGVVLPPPVELPAGAVDRARATLGRGGDWPHPQPGRFCDEDEDEQEGE